MNGSRFRRFETLAIVLIYTKTTEIKGPKMRVIEKQIFTFDELNDSAKERAREWYRRGLEYPFWDEVQSSLRAFCDEFGVKVLDYSIGDPRRSFVKTDASPSTFRGLKLSNFDREAMPTGFCFDCTIRHSFADEWKKTADPFYSFGIALESFLREVESDIDYQYSDEAVDESIEANGYEFDEFGGAA